MGRGGSTGRCGGTYGGTARRFGRRTESCVNNWGWHCGLSGFPNLARLGGKIGWPMMLACTSCSEGEYWWQQEVRACQASIMGRPEMPLALALAAGRPSPS